MTGFDIVVFLIVGIAALAGFLRGFVHEVLALAAWIVALFAIYYLHTPLTRTLQDAISGTAGAAVLAFALLLLVPLFTIRLLARRLGSSARGSVLGPIDRVLGFGFGAVKGLIIVVLGFSVLVLGYDTVWGPEGRPGWISQARSYSFVNAASDELVALIAQRREAARQTASDRADE